MATSALLVSGLLNHSLLDSVGVHTLRACLLGHHPVVIGEHLFLAVSAVDLGSALIGGNH